MVAVSSTLAACGDDDDSGSDPGADLPVIEVTDAGDEPRRVLALSPEVGDEASATMSMDMQFGGTLDGQPLPSEEIPVIDFGMDMSVSDVTDERIDSVFRYEDITVRGGGDAAVQSQLENTLAGLEGASGSLATAPSGQLIAADLQLSDSADPVLSTLATQIEEQFRSITVPFPSEPVGPGATWEVQTGLNLSGVESQLDSTYTLEKLAGDEYTLAIELEQTLEPGEVEGGGEVISGESSGTGTLDGSLGALLPIRSEASTRANTVIEVPVEGGDSQELDQDIALDVTLTSAQPGSTEGG